MSGRAVKGRCRLFHRWRKLMWVDSSLFSITPLDGVRECERCGRRQRYRYDSQGGCWIDVPQSEHDDSCWIACPHPVPIGPADTPIVRPRDGGCP